jgi:hypothetical protein
MSDYGGGTFYFPKTVLVENMMHHAHIARWILSLKKDHVLIVGPGDHTVVDVLRRRGLKIETLDIDTSLNPTYVGDIKNLTLDKKFPCIAANEVLEHSKIESLPNILENLSGILEDDGVLYISVPFSTIRLFPEKGFIVHGAGRVNTQIPLYYYHDVLTPIRKLVRAVKGKKGEIRYIEDYAPERIDVHHWEVGYRPTTKDYVRQILLSKFDIIREGITHYNMPEASNTWNVIMKKRTA